MTELARDQRGATMVEYVILVGVVAIAAMSAFKTYGSQVRAKIDQQADTVSIIQGSESPRASDERRASRFENRATFRGRCMQAHAQTLRFAQLHLWTDARSLNDGNA